MSSPKAFLLAFTTLLVVLLCSPLYALAPGLILMVLLVSPMFCLPDAGFLEDSHSEVGVEAGGDDGYDYFCDVGYY